MAAFFEKMQRSQRVSDDGTLPGYLRTRPVTTERIADAQNRVSALPYKQTPDSAEFHLIRAKLRAEGGDAQDTVTLFERAVNEKRYANEAAARYGLVRASLRARAAEGAAVARAKLPATAVSSPMIDALEARVRQANNDVAGAEKVLAQARTRYPTSRALLYAQVGVRQDASRNERRPRSRIARTRLG